MAISESVSNNVKVLLEKLHLENKTLLKDYSPDRTIYLLDTVLPQYSYSYIPRELSIIWKGIQADYGQNGFDAFQRIVMSTLIMNFAARSSKKKYTPEITNCFGRSFDRIFESIEDPECEDFATINDVLLKDLAICRQKIFPTGAQLVGPDSGFHRAMMFRGGLIQAYRFGALLLQTGGNMGFYQIHTHSRELDEFNPNGWNLCYLRIAEMLALHPEVRGMWGGSWFYDPAMQDVSPRLAYLAKVPKKNGASVFYSEVNIDSGALATSFTRQELYERGQYIPKIYTMIWPRKEMLAWAASAGVSGVSTNT